MILRPLYIYKKFIVSFLITYRQLRQASYPHSSEPLKDDIIDRRQSGLFICTIRHGRHSTGLSSVLRSIFPILSSDNVNVRAIASGTFVSCPCRDRRTCTTRTRFHTWGPLRTYHLHTPYSCAT